MKLTVAGSRLLRQVSNRLYRGPLQHIVQQLGLNKYLSKPYWWLVITLADSTQTHSLADQTVSFHTETFDEFIRFRDLMGERPILEDLLQSLESDDVFYDIGANVGTYTCFAASNLGPNAVVAFEPEPKNATRLRENLDLNDLDAQIVDIALSDTNGTIELTLADGDAGEGKHAIATSGNQTTTEVETARGDTVVKEREVTPPTVAKIDVEGAELSVLRGMEETLQEHCRLVYVEVHADKIGEYGGTAEDVYSVLEDAGFEIETVEQRGSQYFIKGTRQSR